jgi:hypothetical protein
MAAPRRAPLLLALLVVAIIGWLVVSELLSSDQSSVEGLDASPPANTAPLSDAPASAATTNLTDTPRVEVEAPQPAVADATPPSPPEAAPSTPGRIHGTVLGPDGRVAVGRKVRVLRTDGGGVQNFDTDADGHYDARDLEPRRYHVSTTPSEEELTALGLTSAAGGVEWLLQQSVLLAPGEERQVDLGLPPANPIRVTGRLIGGPSGTSALLQWAPEGEYGYDDAKYVRVNDEGAYEVLLASPGPYHVAAIVRPGSARVDHDVVVPSSAAFVHDISLPQGSISVTVTGPAGAPLSGVNVDFVPRGGIAPVPGMSATSYSRRSQEDGRAQLPFARGGEWLVAVHGAKTADGAFLETARQHVTLLEDSTQELRFELGPGLTVTGHIRDADGAPVAGAYAFAFDDLGDPLMPYYGARSGKDGAFILNGLTYGRTRVAAVRGNKWSNVHTLMLSEDSAVAPELELVLAPAGRVIVDRSELGVPAWIEVRDANGLVLSSILDRNLFSGHYSRRAATSTTWFDVPPGKHTVRAVGAHGELERIEIQVDAGEITQVRLGAR